MSLIDRSARSPADVSFPRLFQGNHPQASPGKELLDPHNMIVRTMMALLIFFLLLLELIMLCDYITLYVWILLRFIDWSEH